MEQMAPLGMVDALGWFSSAEAAAVSVVAFFVLGVVLLALCARCNRKPTNAYDVNGPTMEGVAGPKGGTGSAGANGGIANTSFGGTANPGDYTWRDHRNMPASTLDRKLTMTQ